MKPKTTASLVILCGMLAAGGAVAHNYHTLHQPALYGAHIGVSRGMNHYGRGRQMMIPEKHVFFGTPPHSLKSLAAKSTHATAADFQPKTRTAEDLAAVAIARTPPSRRALIHFSRRMMLEPLSAPLDTSR